MVSRGGTLEVTRVPIRLEPDPTRVIGRRFVPGDQARIRGIIDRILAIPEARVEQTMDVLRQRFAGRHIDITDIVDDNYEAVRQYVPDEVPVSGRRKRLIGACFTMEYAIEAAALFNPSMVPAMDQSGVPAGATRFVMSLRATGEGHISSIVFRRGTVDASGNIDVEPPSPVSRQLEVVQDAAHSKEEFRQKLAEIGAYSEHSEQVLARMADPVTFTDLNRAIEEARALHTDS